MMPVSPEPPRWVSFDWSLLTGKMHTSFYLLSLMTIGTMLCDTQARTMLESIYEEDSTGQTLPANTDTVPLQNNALVPNGSILNIPINFLNSESDLQEQLGVEKRQLDQFRIHDVDHHWHCNTTITWKDLGWQHYPRFVREVMCATESCMHGYYMCRSQVYQVRVLTVRDEDDDEEVTVPAILRDRWKFTEVAVSVACLCST